jgi:small GTP-binding protein
MSSFEDKKNAKEILKESSNTNLEPNFKGKSISVNPNIIEKEEEDNINKSNSDIEVNTTTYPLKICFVGNSYVGKTSIIRRFINNKFDEEKIASTISVNFENKKLKIDPYTELNMQIWDTAGQERFRSLTASYLRESNGIFIVFDLSDKKSFDDLISWFEEINKAEINQKNCVKIVIGNKLDSKDKEVDNDTAKKLAEENGMKYLPVSAKDGINIVSMFEIMGEACLKIIQKEENNDDNDDNKIIINKEEIKKSKNEENKEEIKEPEKKVINLANKTKVKQKNKRCC